MEISNFDKSSVIKKNILLDKFTFLKNQHKSNNNNLFSNDDLLYLLDSYINKIQNIDIDIDINTIKIYFNSLLNLYLFLNMNINISYEQKNHFYLNYDEFNNSIIDKLSSLNKTNTNINKIKRKISNLMQEYLTNKQLKLSMNINNINTIEECILNPIFNKYINIDMINNIKNINNFYNKSIKNYEKYKYNLNEVNILNNEFINQIMKYNIVCKDMKNKYICNKYMKNTDDIDIKIHNNIYNFYIKLFCEYFIQLSKIIIKKISEENLKLFRINNKSDKNSNKIIKSHKEEENKVIDLKIILNEGFINAEGISENINKNKINRNILDLSEEFGEKEININNNNQNINNKKLDFEERKKNYQNLFNLKEKLLQENKDNNDIIFNLVKIKNEINNRIKEQEIQKNLLNEKHNQIMKNQKEVLLNEKNLLENEFNNLKLKEIEYKLKFTELKDKYEHQAPNKKENENIFKDIKVNVEKELNENKEKLNMEPKKEIEKEKKKDIISEENKKINDNKNKEIDKNNKINNKEKKSISYFNIDIHLNKELQAIKEQHEIKKEEKENNKNNLNINNIIQNKENNIINNNPFSKEKVKEDEKDEDKILKQKRVLDNLPSTLSNRTNSKNKKETFSPNVIKRGINNDNNISMMFTGLNINNNINNFNNILLDNQSKNKNNSNDKNNSSTNALISDTNTLNIFSQIHNNNENNSNDKNNKTNNTNNNIINSNSNTNLNGSANNTNANLFTFNSNSNNPFNTNISNKENPFSFKPTNNIFNNNNISKSNNIFSQQQNNIKFGQESIFKNFNLSSINTTENKTQEIIFGSHNYNFGKKLNNNVSNNNMNPISISFSNNNFIGNSLNNLNSNNNNNSNSPFTQFNSNQGLNNFKNFTQNSNDDNYF